MNNKVQYIILYRVYNYALSTSIYTSELILCSTISLANQMWFSVACTLINNKYASSQGSKCCGLTRRNKFWPQWWRMSLSIRVQTTPNQIRFVFYHNINIKKVFISVRETWKRHCVTSWRVQRRLDSYRQKQSDYEITSNCGKNSITKGFHKLVVLSRVNNFNLGKSKEK